MNIEVRGMDDKEGEPTKKENKWAFLNLHNSSGATWASGHTPTFKYRPSFQETDSCHLK